ncbi:MAG: NUDIX domain-containing protein [Candidatus Nanoarchaeia archaeon]|jgi:8-oxo-dGTP diphosphatase
MNNYSKRFVTVDAAIFSVINNKLKVFLQIREKEPFKGYYELLGGFVKVNETCEKALERKLKQVSNINIEFFQFKVFSEPSRDPENEVISIGYVSLINERLANTLGKFYDLNDLPKTSFDHKSIIMKARQYLKNNIESIITEKALPEVFSLNCLQKLYEIVTEEKLDNRNFRKKLILKGIVKPTSIKQSSVGHRPAKLYKLSIKN